MKVQRAYRDPDPPQERHEGDGFSIDWATADLAAVMDACRNRLSHSLDDWNSGKSALTHIKRTIVHLKRGKTDGTG